MIMIRLGFVFCYIYGKIAPDLYLTLDVWITLKL